VRVAIDFDHQPARRTVEVDDKRANRMLTTEVEPIEPTAAQVVPERAFGDRRLPPEVPGVLSHHRSGTPRTRSSRHV
jgi:hypothetical protein